MVQVRRRIALNKLSRFRIPTDTAMFGNPEVSRDADNHQSDEEKFVHQFELFSLTMNIQSYNNNNNNFHATDCPQR